MSKEDNYGYQGTIFSRVLQQDYYMKNRIFFEMRNVSWHSIDSRSSEPKKMILILI